MGLAVLLLSLVWATSLVFHGISRCGLSFDRGWSAVLPLGAGCKGWVGTGKHYRHRCCRASALCCFGLQRELGPFLFNEKATPAFDPSSATARVFGTVAFEGETPKTPPMKIGSGDQFCKMNALNIFKHEGSLTEGGAIRNVIIYVRSGHEGRTYKVPEQPVVLDQQRCVYLPRVLTLMKGQKLKILNSDPTFHNVHAQGDGRTEFNIPQALKGRGRHSDIFAGGDALQNWMRLSYLDGVVCRSFRASVSYDFKQRR